MATASTCVIELDWGIDSYTAAAVDSNCGKALAPSNPPPRPPSEWDNATVNETRLLAADRDRLAAHVSKLETALGDERRLRAIAETAKQEADAEVGRLVRAARGRR